MAVLLTVSETLNGTAFNDDLEGPDGIGIDLGSCINGQYAPIISQPANTGHKNVFIRHDAVVDPITDVKTFLQQFGVGTGFTYGGANSAATDLTNDEKGMGLSVKYAMEGAAVKAQFIQASDVGGTSGADATAITLGYDMNLSARTTAYALYNMYSPDTTGASADVTVLSVGVSHSF